MGMREKLIELICEGEQKIVIADLMTPEQQKEYIYSQLADHLIANGVTVQRWIPVSERFPEDVYGKDREKIVVLVRTKIGNVSQCTRVADYACSTDATLSQVKWIKNGEFYWSKGKRVTHWMPLPDPPKGE